MNANTGHVNTSDPQNPVPTGEKMQSIKLNAWFGAKQALKNVDLSIKANAVTAIIGPSGCGKSTFVRCLNRMHELVPGPVRLDKCFLTDETFTRKKSTRS